MSVKIGRSQQLSHSLNLNTTTPEIPDALRWCSRLAMDVGEEGQKRTRCIDSPVRRRGGVK
jgi:hypothetical protein